MLTVHSLRKSYGGVQALRELSFTATPGRVIGLLGPNGSGKSTTINLLTGLMRPSAGTICWHGVDIHQQLVAYQALLGYVPEEPRLYAYLTAVEYLTLVGGLRDLDGTVVARRVLIAVGAMERPVPLPGWTLPGVMTVGAAQIVYKTSGWLPPEGTWIAGSGPLLNT